MNEDALAQLQPASGSEPKSLKEFFDKSGPQPEAGYELLVAAVDENIKMAHEFGCICTKIML
ncbi:hypothetical protein DSO57_1028495 [Entomophthora muscae]|uniref:Uncharacterized protein n=1 Tax=Entomophthora muscae TaxID=34485 RepID=A0ACC2S3J4_9FUNG|nr:hypothetical protein DSO57_1028495 [Entomophthora muscae]